MAHSKKQVFAIIGSASENSANLRLVELIAREISVNVHVEIFDGLKSLPHFDPGLSINNTPHAVAQFRERIAQADAVLICTPEYVFSIPSGLKNAIEWCVSSTVFSDKPCGLITASANGAKAHEELQLLMKTLMARFVDDTTLLIPGVRSRIDPNGAITNDEIKQQVQHFIESFITLINR